MMHALKILLVDGVWDDIAYGWLIYGFTNRLGVVAVIFIRCHTGLHILQIHLPPIIAERPDFSAQRVGSSAHFHSSKAGRIDATGSFNALRTNADSAVASNPQRKENRENSEAWTDLEE